LSRSLARLIRERQPCVVLTGAGMSTESGIPDFRSAEGIWSEVDPFEVASIEAFHRDPERVWRWYGQRIHALLAAQPNPGHLALAELERDGLVEAVVTQNIDTLHSRAGSREVVEVHGSVRRAICLDCGGEQAVEGVVSQLEERVTPICPGCGAVLKPDVVMFGEVLPFEAMARAELLAARAALLVVVGSSLQVWPVADLPAQTLAAGGAVAIVNHEETPYDRRAELLVRAAAGETLAETARILSTT
jgi:NAD-dependent deacetylase